MQYKQTIQKSNQPYLQTVLPGSRAIGNLLQPTWLVCRLTTDNN